MTPAALSLLLALLACTAPDDCERVADSVAQVAENLDTKTEE